MFNPTIRFLIVDDFRANRKVFKNILGDLGSVYVIHVLNRENVSLVAKEQAV